MNEKYSLLGELILKRNDESERKLDYKKYMIYQNWI